MKFIDIRLTGTTSEKEMSINLYQYQGENWEVTWAYAQPIRTMRETSCTSCK